MGLCNEATVGLNYFSLSTYEWMKSIAWYRGIGIAKSSICIMMVLGIGTVSPDRIHYELRSVLRIARL